MLERSVRTVVVGSGCAGLNAADTLASLGETSLLLVTEEMNAGTSRNTGSDKQTYYKLSLAGDEGDSVGEMARDLKGADVHGDLALCEAAASAQCFFKLVSLGVPFPTNGYGEYAGYQTDHDERRRATSVGPLTSRRMTEALEKSVRSRRVPILDHAVAVRIVTGRAGVEGLDVYLPEEQAFMRIHCAHVILCTGGPAGIYEDRVYPESQHGMSSLAFSAGAAGANLDCWQYGLASVGFRWNLSGSYQQALPRYVSVDDRGCEYEFLADAMGEEEAIRNIFLKGYQWPFDESRPEGSSRVDLLVRRENDMNRRVYLDYMRNPRGYDPERLPREVRTYLENCGALLDTPIARLRAINEPAIDLYRAHGTDLARERLEIRVCAQHHNGGISVDDHWQTCVTGLYVCGEAAGTFGRKRPGGSALNSTQAGSLRAAQHAFRSGRKVRECSGKMEQLLLPRGDARPFQREMSRVAAFRRDSEGMEKLKKQVEEALNDLSPAEAGEGDLRERLLLKDLLITQREVLSAMLYAFEEKGAVPGVLLTEQGRSRRIPARPIPQRNLWFEQVWKEYREEIPEGDSSERTFR